MAQQKLPEPVISAATGLSRFVLPLPDVCQDFLYHRVLDRWLNAHPTIRDAIIWDFGVGVGPVPYANWPAERKQPLQRAFPFGYPFELQDPPPNLVTLGDDEYPRTILSENDAWALYLNHIAQSLANDYWSALPWSLDELTNYGRALILDGRAFFTRRPEGYEVDMWEAGRALAAPPVLVYNFLQSNGLIGQSRLDTIGRILDWCRSHLVHYLNRFETLNVEYQWQYRGFPPVSRMISGTPRTDPAYPSTTLQHRTAGCHGTNGFLQAVLRVVNVPVRYANPLGSGHATPLFVSEDRFLSHGDDPYNQYSKATPPYPAGDLLIDRTTYDNWFPPSPTDPDLNIGRQVKELALIHLPDALLQAHCADLAAGRNHASSDVYQVFSRWYAVSELEVQNLWTRLDAKVTSFGGCANIP